MSKRNFEIFANIFLWVITGWVITHSFSIVNVEQIIENGETTTEIYRSDDVTIKLMLCIGFSIIMFYLNLYLILFHDRTKMVTLVIKSLLLPIITIILFILIVKFSILSTFPKIPVHVIEGTVVFYYSISIAYGIGKVWVSTEMQRRSLEIQKKQAELTLLRSQLHPHFLFNVLNNLLSMVDQVNNPNLANAIDKLSGLLRYVVYDTTGSKVSIAREIAFIKNYVDLQLLRFEKDEVQFELDIFGDYDEQLIEPGIFIPFVENAFKYGAEPEQQSPISISFDLTSANKILFKITNVVSASYSTSTAGTGIRTTRERLALVYPETHELIITAHDSMFTVHLEITTQ